jgi:chitinase
MSSVPVILGAYDREIERYSDFDPSAGVTALDSTGKDVTYCMELEGDVDTNTCGIYKVTYKVTDETGIEATATATIIVKDDEAPVLYVDQVVDSIGAYDVNSSKQLHDLLLQNVTAYDGRVKLDDSAILVDYSEVLEKGYGKCHVKYRATDSEGNQSDVVVLSVDVDVEAPKVELKSNAKSDIRVSKLLDDDYLLGLVEATDNSGKVEVSVSRPLTYTVNEPYIVIYCARDDFGNVTTFSVTYQVVK